MSTPHEIAVLAAVPAEAAPVVVLGTGGTAERLRRALGDRTGGGRPAAVVDTTGEIGEIEHALASVEDLGTVVLAGPPPPPPVPLDLYADLHLRGLTVVGVPAPGTAG